MTALMVKMGDGFYIPKLDGYDDIKKDTISVTIDLSEEEYRSLSYKELKGIAIMERYYEKQKNEIETDTAFTQDQIAFRKKHRIDMNLDDYLRA